jgi:sulfane dehydrogenase subunit SoxC
MTAQSWGRGRGRDDAQYKKNGARRMSRRRETDASTREVAARGRLDRRGFLGAGAALAGALAFERPVWAETGAPAGLAMPPANPSSMLQPGGPFTNYGQPSPFEKGVIRWITSNPDVPGNGIAWCPLQDLEGIVTPNGLHYERHHDGVPAIDPAAHRLLIHGLVEKPLVFDVPTLLRYPMQSRLVFIECGGNSNAGWNPEPIQSRVGHFNGLVSCAEWTGVPLSVLLTEAGIGKKAKWLLAEGADPMAFSVSIPAEKAMEDGILALYQNGEKLRPENGYPMRLVLPGFEGTSHVKWLRRLKAVEEPVMTRDETSKYTDLLKNGKARQFVFVIEPKSLIVSPSPGMKLPTPGLYQVSGLAWSGHGKVAKVEVSADAGKSWSEAALQEPVLRHCFTRFRMPWRWDGKPAVLQSRVTDEKGNVQPTREALLKERSEFDYFHYNAILSWAVSAEGTIAHVYA